MEGKLMRDIESAWIKMEKVEHERELSLREELIREERLEQLEEKFERKVRWQQDVFVYGFINMVAIRGV